MGMFFQGVSAIGDNFKPTILLGNVPLKSKMIKVLLRCQKQQISKKDFLKSLA